MAISGIGDYAGAVFTYFQKAWMNMPIRDFMTPLTNSKYLVKATIPAESGQGVKFRYFPEWNVEATSSSNSAPKEYNENTEPSAGNTLVPVLVEAPLTFFASYTDLGNFAMATDPTDLLAKSKENFRLQLRRWMHQIANQRCVVKLTDGLRADSGATVTAGNIPSAFSTIYAGGLATFGQLVADSVIPLTTSSARLPCCARMAFPRPLAVARVEAAGTCASLTTHSSSSSKRTSISAGHVTHVTSNQA